jgi:hypothetical protein
MKAGSRGHLIEGNPQIGPMEGRIWAIHGSGPMRQRKTGRCLGRWTCTCDAPQGRRRNRKAKERIRRAGKESDSPRSSQSTQGTNQRNTATNGTERTDWHWETGCPDFRRQSREKTEGRRRKRNETKGTERIQKSSKMSPRRRDEIKRANY